MAGIIVFALEGCPGNINYKSRKADESEQWFHPPGIFAAGVTKTMDRFPQIYCCHTKRLIIMKDARSTSH